MNVTLESQSFLTQVMISTYWINMVHLQSTWSGNAFNTGFLFLNCFRQRKEWCSSRFFFFIFAVKLSWLHRILQWKKVFLHSSTLWIVRKNSPISILFSSNFGFFIQILLWQGNFFGAFKSLEKENPDPH